MVVVRKGRKGFVNYLESAHWFCPVLVLPCVRFSTDSCWGSSGLRPALRGRLRERKKDRVCVCGVQVLVGDSVPKWRATVWVVECEPLRPLPHPSLPILHSVTWMNNRDVQWYRLPCC